MTATAKIERRIALAPSGKVFTVDDFLGFASPAAVKSTLSRLSKRGVIDRARRGLYFKPRISRFGRVTLRAEDIALAAAQGKAPGPAGPSAASSLGLSTQIPPCPTIAVVGNRPVSVPDVRFVERSNVERVAAGLRPLEIALLEVLRDDLKWVEVSEPAVGARLRELIANGDVSERRVRRAAKHEPRRVALKLEELLSA
jgi:predicted transcriptional regulator of viral defense system